MSSKVWVISCCSDVAYMNSKTHIPLLSHTRSLEASRKCISMYSKLRFNSPLRPRFKSAWMWNFGEVCRNRVTSIPLTFSHFPEAENTIEYKFTSSTTLACACGIIKGPKDDLRIYYPPPSFPVRLPSILHTTRPQQRQHTHNLKIHHQPIWERPDHLYLFIFTRMASSSPSFVGPGSSQTTNGSQPAEMNVSKAKKVPVLRWVLDAFLWGPLTNMIYTGSLRSS